ncbi:MAG: hypothetical protein AAF503_02995 [Pseudomonadota bacterium]
MTRWLAMAALAAFPIAAQDVPQNGMAITRWHGATHQAYFADPLEWARFQDLLTSEEFREIRIATAGETRVRVAGRYLVLTGCLPTACSSTRAGLGIEIETGTTSAVVWQENLDPRRFYHPGKPLPPELDALARNGVLE